MRAPAAVTLSALRQAKAQSVAPVLVALLPTVLLLAFVPPAFNRIDAYVMLLQQYSRLIPHYPPLYPFFARAITGVFGLSDVAIYVIILLQHLVLVTGLVYVAFAFKGTTARVLVVTAIAWGGGLGLYSHGVFSEGLAMPLLVWLLGAAVRVANAAQERPRQTLLPFYGLLFLCILTRHNLAVFAAILPTLFVLLALCERSVFRQRIGQAAVHIAAGVCTIVLANLCVTLVTHVTDGNATRIFGRAVVYRMHFLPWEELTDSQRHALVEQIAMRSSDPIVQQTARIMMETPSPWLGTYQRVREHLEAQGSQRNIDEVMNAAGRAFILTPNTMLYAQILKTLDQYFRRHNQVPWFVGQATDAIELYRSGRVPEPFTKLGLISSIDVTEYQRITHVIPPRVYFWSTHLYLLGAIILVALGITWSRGIMPSAFGALSVALLLSACVYAFLTAVVTTFHVRYGAPVVLMFWASLAVIVGAVGHGSLGRSENG